MQGLLERWRRRRKLELERWLALWIIVPSLGLQIAGCEGVALAACICNGVSDSYEHPGDIVEFTVLSPVDGETYTDQVLCDFRLSTDLESGPNDATVLITLGSGATGSWRPGQGPIACTPQGDSGPVTYSFMAVSDHTDDVRMETATIQWTAMSTLRLAECYPDGVTGCAAPGPAEIRGESLYIKPNVDHDASLLTGFSVTVDGIPAGSATAAPWLVEVVPQLGGLGAATLVGTATRSTGDPLIAEFSFSVSKTVAVLICTSGGLSCNEVFSTNVTGTIEVGANVEVVPADVTDVEYFVDGVSVGTSSTISPYIVTLDTTGLAAGPHSLRAMGTRASGFHFSGIAEIVVQ